MVQTNNGLYKEICENYGITIESGVHTNNYYLHRIAEGVCRKTYSELECNGKYLKDIAEELAETTYNSHHFNNFYLEKICTALTGLDYNTEYDNYFLEVWSNSIEALKTPTILILDTPMVILDEEFEVTGTLTDDEDTPLGGKSVRLEWTNGVVGDSATLTTTSDGKVVFESHESATLTEYTFQLFFDGDEDYKNCNSSVVTVDVKQRAILNLTSPANKSVVTTNSVTVTGTLKDVNDNPIEGALIDIMIKEDRSSWIEISTDSNGAFSREVSFSNVEGTKTVSVGYNERHTYAPTEQEVLVHYIVAGDFSLSADSVLSYADGDTTDVTVQLLSNGAIAPINGVSVTLYKDGSVWHTADTDSNGRVSKTYTSAGVGDVVFTAEVSGMSLTKSYTVEDCNKYIGTAQTITQSDNSTFGLQNVFQYPNSPVKFSAIVKQTHSTIQINTILGVSANTGTFSNSTNPKELTLGFYSNTVGLGYYNGGNNAQFTSINRSNFTASDNVEYLIEMELRADSKVYGKVTRVSDSNVLFEATETIPFSITDYYLVLHQRANGTASFREVKVKSL